MSSTQDCTYPKIFLFWSRSTRAVVGPTTASAIDIRLNQMSGINRDSDLGAFVPWKDRSSILQTNGVSGSAIFNSYVVVTHFLSTYFTSVGMRANNT